MNASLSFKLFAELVKKTCPEKDPVVNVDIDVKSFEVFYPEILEVIKKDQSIFSVERTVFGVNISDAWKVEGDKTELWKQFHTCLLTSFLHGDIKEKITPLVNMFKSYWAGGGGGEAASDEINKILNDEESESKFKEILTFISETRIAKLFMSVIEQIDITDIGLDFENPNEFIEIIKNPEHPISAKIIGRIQNIIKVKVQRGEISQRQIEAEVEQIKTKLTLVFGDMFKEAMGLGGAGGAEVPPTVLMGNSPEARRQRMIARLQKKQREKNL
jgi:hypothetical protein